MCLLFCKLSHIFLLYSRMDQLDSSNWYPDIDNFNICLDYSCCPHWFCPFMIFCCHFYIAPILLWNSILAQMVHRIEYDFDVNILSYSMKLIPELHLLTSLKHLNLEWLRPEISLVTQLDNLVLLTTDIANPSPTLLEFY